MTDRDQDSIWEYFQAIGMEVFSAAEPRYAALVRTAVRRMRGRSGRALNIGAGSGGVERRLLALGWEVATLDLTAVAVERLRALGVDARQGRAEAMPFADGCFDVVIASEVLEHISSSERSQSISEVARILRPGGWFIGTVPYRENLRDNEAVCPACGHVFHRWGHADSFDKRKTRARAERGVGGAPVPVSGVRRLAKRDKERTTSVRQSCREMCAGSTGRRRCVSQPLLRGRKASRNLWALK
jgi:SAM-dependent methyltransferase